MLAKDELTQKRWLQEAAKEEAAERSRRSLAKHLESNQVTVLDDAGRDVSDEQAQMGKSMTALDVIGKLKKCNSRLEFVRHPLYSLYGIYLRDATAPILKFKVPGFAVHHQSFRGRHICGMEPGILPEFSIIHKKKIKVPDKDLLGSTEPTREVKWKEIWTVDHETRGWRTVIIRLLHAGLITDYDVTTHFGAAPSKDSRKWYEAIQ
jgi:hypothetical protein